MPSKPRFLYFDLGNVLFCFDHERICQQIADVAGRLPVGDVTAFVNRYYGDLESGQVAIEAVYDEFCEVFGVAPGLDVVCHAASDIFWLNAKLTPLLTRLTMANHRMGILSNTSQPHWDFLQSRGYAFFKMFELAVLSYEVKSPKPNREIFERATQLAGVPANKIFFTDDRTENVDGARAAGWQAELFTSAHALEESLRRRGLRFD